MSKMTNCLADYVLGLSVLVAITLLAIPAYAQPSSSNNFEIREDSLGPGGGSGESANFGVEDSVGGSGGFGVGEANSPSNQSQTGAITPDEPALAFTVDSTQLDFGSLSTSLTRTGTATFTVSNYVSSGYVVQIVGDPPNNGNHTIAAMGSPAASSPGVEQFGINLSANTAPIAFGAVPVQEPDGTFGFGAAASGYNTANNFQYGNGDVIANATKSSGRTSYTISYIMNISNDTPGGSYTGQQSLVITGTY